MGKSFKRNYRSIRKGIARIMCAQTKKSYEVGETSSREGRRDLEKTETGLKGEEEKHEDGA